MANTAIAAQPGEDRHNILNVADLDPGIIAAEAVDLDRHLGVLAAKRENQLTGAVLES